MEGKQGRQKFEEADRLFQAGRYEDALSSLQALNAAYPNTKNILFPMALCLERLGRTTEAIPICTDLAERFQDRRALEMQHRLDSTFSAPSLDDLQIDMDFALPDLGPVKTIPVPVQEDEGPSVWVVAGTIGGVLLLVLGLFCLPFLLQKIGILEVSEPIEAAPSRISLFDVAMALFGFVVFQGLGTGVAALALGTVKKLPANSISGVLLHAGMTLLAANAVALLISLVLVVVAPLELFWTLFLVEHVVMTVFFWRTYRFTAGDTFVFLFFFSIFMWVAAFTTAMVLGTGFGVAGFLFAGMG